MVLERQRVKHEQAWIPGREKAPARNDRTEGKGYEGG